VRRPAATRQEARAREDRGVRGRESREAEEKWRREYDKGSEGSEVMGEETKKTL
tara:strand:+ start:516 stop:677 length:162 start_codon:yes stop_codon:yes gene_type:complete